ncbi:MAG: LysR family transcriptional regulator [Duodenibacillus sp.]|nr:LysR family transcriptional regulator [Duodenibacillus sp.]
MAERLSMSQAARELCLTQSAVSHAVARLEERLGCRLFSRTTRRMALTQEGQALFEATRRMTGALSAGLARIDALQTLQSGRLRIAVPVLIMHLMLMPVLAKFHRMFPGVVIETVIDNHHDELLRLVRSGEADLMIVTSPEGALPEQDVDAEVLGGFSYCFTASRKAFGGLEGRTVELSELSSYPIACLSPGHIARTALEAAFARRGLAPDVRFNCEVMALVEDYVIAGLGIGLTITGCIRQMKDCRDVFVIRTPEPVASGSLVLVTRRGAALPRAAAVLAGQIRKAQARSVQRRP